jgi:hypothetical protein
MRTLARGGTATAVLKKPRAVVRRTAPLNFQAPPTRIWTRYYWTPEPGRT